MEYVCNGYHRNGKTVCSPHRVREEYIDEQLMMYVQTLQRTLSAELEDLRAASKTYDIYRPRIAARISELKAEVMDREEEIEALTMMKIKG